MRLERITQGETEHYAANSTFATNTERTLLCRTNVEGCESVSLLHPFEDDTRGSSSEATTNAQQTTDAPKEMLVSKPQDGSRTDIPRFKPIKSRLSEAAGQL